MGEIAGWRWGACILDGGSPYFTDRVQRTELRRQVEYSLKRTPVPWGRGPGQAGDGLALSPHQILERLADRLGVSQIVVPLHEAAEELFLRRAPHLPDLQVAQLGRRMGTRVLFNLNSAVDLTAELPAVPWWLLAFRYRALIAF